MEEVRDVLYLQHDQKVALSRAPASGGQGGRYFLGGALHEGRLLPLPDVARFAQSDFEVDDGA